MRCSLVRRKKLSSDSSHGKIKKLEVRPRGATAYAGLLDRTTRDTPYFSPNNNSIRWRARLMPCPPLRVLRIRGSVLDSCQLRQPSDAKPSRHRPGDSLRHV